MEETRRPSIVDFNLPTITLIGRVNVGKSTFFNKLMEKFQALVSDEPGTTRTRNIGNFTWRGVQARLVDAGGLTFDENAEFEEEILDQTLKGIAEADIVLFIVDGQAGLMPQEREIAKILRKKKVKTLLVANKVDAPRMRTTVHEGEWMKLGLGEPRIISAANGVGVGDLLDEVFKFFHTGSRRRPKEVKIKPSIRVAILGKPNVGKSTLLNQIAGKDIVITSPVAHTTRETFNLLVQWGEHYIEFKDTAGIRRKAHVSRGLEKMGVSQSIRQMQDADVILLMVDATEPISVQEKVLGRLVDDKRRSMVIVVNKWDLVEDHSEENRKKFIDAMHVQYPHLSHAEIIFVSAKSGFRVHQLYEVITQAFDSRYKQIPALELDSFLRQLISKHPPQRGIGNVPPKIYGLKQLANNPPEFQVSVKAKTSLNSSYLKFIERALREKFGFVGTPIIMYTKKTKL